MKQDNEMIDHGTVRVETGGNWYVGPDDMAVDQRHFTGGISGDD
jgi:hypothetical protein